MVLRVGGLKLCSMLSNVQFQHVRFGHRIRGKSPMVARSLKERLDELNEKDEIYTTRIDIGLPAPKKLRSKELYERLGYLKQKKLDTNFEYLARNHKLIADINEVKKDWLSTKGPQVIKGIAEHYGVYEHLYGEGYFIPQVSLEISYQQSNEVAAPVYYGNVIKPSEAQRKPEVTYESEEDILWTLALTNLDGNLKDGEKEYIHWFVANIPGNEVSKGDEIVEYLQPIPPQGTGFHRYVFVLYKQNKKLDYGMSGVQLTSPLDERTFVTRDWYSSHQNDITPAGLAFYQSDYDSSLRDFYHNTLKMKEPIFEYDFDPPYIKPQEWFPLREPFNLYMDKYRDPKQINKEYLVRKLKDVHPFNPPEAPLKFPNAQPQPKDMPSWLKLHERKLRLRWGRVNDV